MTIQKTVFILATIILAGIGIYKINTKSELEIVDAPQQNTQMSQTNKPSPTTDEQVGDINKITFQTYNNINIGYPFEISFPEKWNIKSLDNYFVIQPNNLKDIFYAPITISISNNNESITSWFLNSYPKNTKDITDFTMINIEGSDEAISWYHSSDPIKIYTYFIQKEDKLYIFSLMDAQKDIDKANEMMQKIVYSFKFID